jgi:hypothetical protein
MEENSLTILLDRVLVCSRVEVVFLSIATDIQYIVQVESASLNFCFYLDPRYSDLRSRSYDRKIVRHHNFNSQSTDRNNVTKF